MVMVMYLSKDGRTDGRYPSLHLHNEKRRTSEHAVMIFQATVVVTVRFDVISVFVSVLF